MASKSTRRAHSSPRHHGGALLSSTKVALASTAAAAAAQTAVWSSRRNLVTSVAHASALPTGRGSARKRRACGFHPSRAWRHAGETHSSFASSKASWAASRCLVPPCLAYAIGRGSKRPREQEDCYVAALHQRKPLAGTCCGRMLCKGCANTF